MRSGSSNAERAYHVAGGGVGGVGGVAVGGGPGSRTPLAARTPRRELGTDRAVVHASGGHARERALQDPGLKDYVRCVPPPCPSSPNSPSTGIACGAGEAC